MKKLTILSLLITSVIALSSCGDAPTHSYGAVWSSDATGHRRVCTDDGCDSVSAEAAHSYGALTVTRPAESDRVGAGVRRCAVCGYQREEEIPALPHVCTVSEEYESDPQAHWHPCLSCDRRHGEEEHIRNGGTVITEATSDSEGEMLYTCTVCGRAQRVRLDPIPDSISEEEWRTAFALDNIRVAECITMGSVSSNETVYLIDGDLACRELDGDLEYMHRSDVELFDFSDCYDSFVHRGAGVYYADRVSGVGAPAGYSISAVTAIFSDGELRELEATVSMISIFNNIKYRYTYADRGEISLSPVRLTDGVLEEVFKPEAFLCDLELEYGRLKAQMRLESYTVTAQGGKYTYKRFNDSSPVKSGEGETGELADGLSASLYSMMDGLCAEDFVYSDSTSLYTYIGTEDIDTATLEIRDGRLYSLFISLQNGTYTYIDITYNS